MTIVASNVDSVRADPAAGSDWRQSMREAIRDGGELCRRLRLPAEYWPAAERASRLFPVFAPLGFVNRMRIGDPHDPLLRQVLPLAEELQIDGNASPDPVGDRQALVKPGLLRKYRGRVLLIAAGACAVHCRYCFRRNFPYAGAPKSLEQWRPALDEIRSDRRIEEVLLSGGDPLTLVDDVLAGLVGQLERIPHLRRLRIHSRLPIVIPERVTAEMLAWMRPSRVSKLVVVHANHPAEIDETVRGALARLIEGGIPVLNQSVLLKGVNDSAEVLGELSQKLCDCRVMPYYLHQLDRVSGASHFEVDPAVGIEIIGKLREALPGYAVPRYVREVAGAPNKIVLA